MKSAIDCFLPSIEASVIILKQIGKEHPCYYDKKQALRRDIQYYTHSMDWKISVDAFNFCKERNIDVNKLPKKCSAIKIVGGEKNKPNLLGEHSTPIGEFIKTLIDKPIEMLRDLLVDYSPVVWITRDENDKLNKNKFSNVRPGGWKKCYEICGIVVMD